MTTPNLIRAISRWSLSPHALLRRGGESTPTRNLQRRWETTTAKSGEKPMNKSESSKSTSSPKVTKSNTFVPPAVPNKYYGPSIPNRVWKSPIASEQNPLKYSIRRTLPYNTLPVYSVLKPGLGQIWTLIKKIDGDLYQFKNDLVLDFPDSKPILKLHLNQVLCRGKITKEIKLWLQDRGF